MPVARFDYASPRSVDEALKLLKDHGDGAQIIAGGTDLLVKVRQGLLMPTLVIGLKNIGGLAAITFDRKDGLTIGATSLLADVASHPDIRRVYPAVAYAAWKTATVQIRNMGTVAGNLCNAAPSADNAPALIAMNAEVILARPGGVRRLPLEQFFLGPGETAMESAEILTAIRVPPPPPRSGTSYQHISARGKVDISAVGIGIMVVMKGHTCEDVRIVMGAVGPTPMRATRAEKLLIGKRLTRRQIQDAGQSASGASQPISDARASAEYRREMVAVLTRRALAEARDRATHGKTQRS
jgi:carbon-monoxide dehydrogenase medium subunit